MFEVGSMVLCVRHFELETKYPNIRFPQLGEYYWVRDVIFHHNTRTVGLTFQEIRNGLVQMEEGSVPQEPNFLAENFLMILKPLPKMDVTEIIRKCMKT